MSQFGETFKRILIEQGYSISNFSKLAALDRGWLYAIFSGKRKLSEQNLQKILSGNFFTPENCQRLRQIYYQEVYGEEQMERILFLQSHFSEFYPPEVTSSPGLPPMAASVPDTGYLSSPPELYGAVYRLLLEIPSSAPDQKVFTNLPFEFSRLDDLLYRSLQSSQPNNTLYRIVPLLQNGEGTYNLKALFSSLRYFHQQARLYCYYTDQPNGQLTDQLFPYYLITPTAVILLHQTGQQGLLVRDQGFCAKMQDDFLNALKSCSEMTFSYPNALAFLSNSHELRSTEYTVELGNTMTMLLDRTILEQYGSPKFTGVSRQGIISSLLNLLQQQASNSKNNLLLLSRQTILDFLRTGTFPNIPRDYMDPLSVEHRLELLNRIGTHLKQYPTQSLGILDDRVFGEYRNEFTISLTQQDNGIIICGQRQPKTGQSFLGECGLRVSNAVLYNDFLNFFDYARRNHYIYDLENSLAILQELSLEAIQKNAVPTSTREQPLSETSPFPDSGKAAAGAAK